MKYCLKRLVVSRGGRRGHWSTRASDQHMRHWGGVGEGRTSDTQPAFNKITKVLSPPRHFTDLTCRFYEMISHYCMWCRGVSVLTPLWFYRDVVAIMSLDSFLDCLVGVRGITTSPCTTKTPTTPAAATVSSTASLWTQ